MEIRRKKKGEGYSVVLGPGAAKAVADSMATLHHFFLLPVTLKWGSLKLTQHKLNENLSQIRTLNIFAVCVTQCTTGRFGTPRACIQCSECNNQLQSVKYWLQKTNKRTKLPFLVLCTSSISNGLSGLSWMLYINFLWESDPCQKYQIKLWLARFGPVKSKLSTHCQDDNDKQSHMLCIVLSRDTKQNKKPNTET